MHRIQIEMTWIDLNINEVFKGCQPCQSFPAREYVVWKLRNLLSHQHHQALPPEPQGQEEGRPLGWR